MLAVDVLKRLEYRVGGSVGGGGLSEQLTNLFFTSVCLS